MPEEQVQGFIMSPLQSLAWCKLRLKGAWLCLFVIVLCLVAQFWLGTDAAHLPTVLPVNRTLISIIVHLGRNSDIPTMTFL